MARRLIIVDVGNTSTAVGVFYRGRVSSVVHCDGGFVEASPLVAKLGPCEGIVYASVVPALDSKWRRFARQHGWGFNLLAVGDFLARSGLKLDYPEPETVGIDRLCDAAAAVNKYGAPVLVMDFGTALTAAVVTRDRVWRGGVIAPGFPLMRDYLFERTAKLPRMELGRGCAPKIGRTTAEAMRFGALVGYRGMVREIVSQLQRNFKEDFRLIATGGFAKWALRDLDMKFTIDPTLTLYGAGILGGGLE